jgi:collagenase-like PrtC family protease
MPRKIKEEFDALADVIIVSVTEIVSRKRTNSFQKLSIKKLGNTGRI